MGYENDWARDAVDADGDGRDAGSVDGGVDGDGDDAADDERILADAN